MYVYGHHIYHNMDQSSKVANPARGQLNREKMSLSAFAPENLVAVTYAIVHPVLRGLLDREKIRETSTKLQRKHNKNVKTRQKRPPGNNYQVYT